MQNIEPLLKHYDTIKNIHLSTLLADQTRNSALQCRFQEIIFDYAHEKVTLQTVTHHLPHLVQSSHLFEQLEGMFSGEQINCTQKRAVLHTLLRSPLQSPLLSPALAPQLQKVHKVLNDIEEFTCKIRKGQMRGATNKSLTDIVVVGIGGSYLSLQFVYEALRWHPNYPSEGRTLRFLANVDPIDLHRALQGLSCESTLVVVNSKTFTTAETMLNAKAVKQWLIQKYKALHYYQEETIVAHHICACSTNLNQKNVFGIWDYVGGRFSVWSAVGILPLSLYFGYDVMRQFLKGGHSIDQHLLNERDITKNIPMMLGLLGFYRNAAMKLPNKAIIPYCQSLWRFAPHIQQLDMQSNGKRVNKRGEVLGYGTAGVNFGEPGTNGQHSFFQLLHQGRTTPVQFIGFTRSQRPSTLPTEPVSNHDELMSNFFSQPDALAIGKSKANSSDPQWLKPHKEFPGDKPSCSLLFVGELDAYKCGQLLSIYQHRTSVQGFLWEVNSYDQFGVELGKTLAKNVRNVFQIGSIQKQVFNSSTASLINHYLNNRI